MCVGSANPCTGVSWFLMMSSIGSVPKDEMKGDPFREGPYLFLLGALTYNQPRPTLISWLQVC